MKSASSIAIECAIFARIEHTRLDRGRGDPDDLGNLPDRFAVIVNKVDDLAVLGREPFSRAAACSEILPADAIRPSARPLGSWGRWLSRSDLVLWHEV